MCFNFMTGRTGQSTGPQSSADKAAGGFRPSGNTTTQTNTANPQSDTGTAQGRRAAVQNQQTTDRNTIRRADSYGSKQAASKVVKKVTTNTSAVQGGKNIMNALNDYNKSNNKKTILGS